MTVQNAHATQPHLQPLQAAFHAFRDFCLEHVTLKDHKRFHELASALYKEICVLNEGSSALKNTMMTGEKLYNNIVEKLTGEPQSPEICDQCEKPLDIHVRRQMTSDPSTEPCEIREMPDVRIVVQRNPDEIKATRQGTGWLLNGSYWVNDADFNRIYVDATARRWIPVSEKLPDVGEEVLVYTSLSVFEICEWDGTWNGNLRGEIGNPETVMFWRPLPLAPEKK
jgi:hypothetical protein